MRKGWDKDMEQEKLYVIEEKSHKEIAAMLGIKEDSSASQLHRAKALLAKQIKEYKSKSRQRI